MQVAVCGIAGGSGSGKSTLTAQLHEAIGPTRSSVLRFDWYYLPLADMPPGQRAAVNFDDPDSLDVDLFVRHLDELRSGRGVEAPTYDFAVNSRGDATRRVDAKSIVIAEGVLLLAFPEVCARLDHRVFLDIPTSLRRERRMHRDVTERGRAPEHVRWQLDNHVEPMHDRYVQPSAVHADRIVTAHEDRPALLEELTAALP